MDSGLLSLARLKNAFIKKQQKLMTALYRGEYTSEFIPTPRNSTILHLHDFHVGYTDVDVVVAALRFAKYDIAILSEVVDFPGFAPFLDIKQTNTRKELLASADLFQMMLDSGIKQIYVLPANHDKRVLKRLIEGLRRPEAVEIAYEAFEDYQKKLQKINKYITYLRAFYVNCGDVWITHGDKYLLTPGGAPREVVKTLGAQAGVYNFNIEKTSLIIAAHEHRHCDTVAEGCQIRVWSMPCCCFEPFYALGRHPNRYTRYPSVTGWGITRHDRTGAVVHHLSNIIVYGYVKMPKSAGKYSPEQSELPGRTEMNGEPERQSRFVRHKMGATKNAKK